MTGVSSIVLISLIQLPLGQQTSTPFPAGDGKGQHSQLSPGAPSPARPAAPSPARAPQTPQTPHTPSQEELKLQEETKTALKELQEEFNMYRREKNENQEYAN